MVVAGARDQWVDVAPRPGPFPEPPSGPSAPGPAVWTSAGHNGPVPPSADPHRSIVSAVSRREAQILDAFDRSGADALSSPSALPGWSRLTIACHLRYGAEALLRMTRAGLAGERAAYYPRGRARQRPETLDPAPGEEAGDVVESLRVLSAELDRTWGALDSETWGAAVVEPDDNPDLGTVQVSDLPLVRLTEVEVHGSDLDLGLDDWSDLFVTTALPARLARLRVRRTNHRPFDETVEGSWLLVAVDGPTFVVSVAGGVVESEQADPGQPATAVIEATSRDLLALLLGRPSNRTPTVRGDLAFGRAFSSAFPGP